MLNLETEDHVIRGARLRIRDDTVVAYELVCVPVDLLPRTNGTSALLDIHALAAANRLALGEATERISQVAADRVIADHLDVARGSRINMLDRIIVLRTGVPIEWRIAFVVPT